ncbi:MAG: tetratricopeptide repeat protein [Eubacteriales bacterium]|nr:tetratricopeptide repeat protein [Eubacteriales bacterium]
MSLFDLFKTGNPGVKAYRTHAAANRLNDAGKVAESEARYAEAMELYQQAEAAGENSPKILTGFCVLLMRDGQYARAKDIIVKIFPDRTLTQDDKYHLRINHAVCQWKLGYIDKALEDMTKAAEFAKIGLYYTVMGAILVDKAHQEGDYAAAEAFMQEAMEYDDEDISTIDNIGWLNYYQQDVDAAKARFKQAIAMNARYSPALAGMAAIAHDLGKDDKAREYVNRALEVHFPTTSPVNRAWTEELKKTIG